MSMPAGWSCDVCDLMSYGPIHDTVCDPMSHVPKMRHVHIMRLKFTCARGVPLVQVKVKVKVMVGHAVKVDRS